MRIRIARADDADSIADLHAAVWQVTYATIAPGDAKVALDRPFRRQRWATHFIDPPQRVQVVVAETEGGIAGFGSAGPAGLDAFGGRGEVKFLYVDVQQQGRGIGRALLGRLAMHLQSIGCHGAALGVVEGNAPAIAFYERLGGHKIGTYTDPGPVWRSHNLIYAWDDVQELMALSRPA